MRKLQNAVKQKIEVEQMKKGKKLLLGTVFLGVVGGSLYAAYSNDMLDGVMNGELSAMLDQVLNPSVEAEEVETANYKETTVLRGNLITGVAESGSVAIGSVTQICDLSGQNSSSESSSAGGTSGGSSSGGASSAGSAFGGGSMGGGMNSFVLMGDAGRSSSSGSSSDTAESATTVDASLIVEEVYVAIGQRVEEGEPILKLSDESIEEYRAALEASVTSAELAVTQAKITRDENALTYNYDYQTNLAKGEVAQAEYDNTIAGLQNQVTELEASIADSLETINELTTDLANGEDVEDDLEAEQENYAELCTKLLTAQNNLITGTITAKQTYDLAMLNYENADSLYEIDVDDLDSELEDAEETLASLKEELEAFEAFIGDGIIYSEYSGVITEVGFAKEDELTDAATVASFQNAEDVTISVSVNQEDIASIAVGDRVVIDLTAYEDTDFEGVVESISTSASSGSSTVNYTVTVLFTGDVTRVYADMTGTATFVEEEAADVLYVSKKAIQQENGVSYVKVLESDGTIRRQEVETGFTDGYQTEISSGLEEGETVIIESQVK